MGIDQTPKFDDAHKTETVMMLMEQGREFKRQGQYDDAFEKFNDAWAHANSEGPNNLRDFVEQEMKKEGLKRTSYNF